MASFNKNLIELMEMQSLDEVLFSAVRAKFDNGSTFDKYAWDTIISLVQRGKNINATKAIRSYYGLGLTEAITINKLMRSIYAPVIS